MTDFFDQIPPELYDLSLPAVVPGVQEARRIRAGILADAMDLSQPWSGADFGIGTGSDAATLLPVGAAGTLHGFDNSLRLTEKLRATKRLPSSRHEGVDVRVILTDLGASCSFERMAGSLTGHLDFVTSAFAIHNLEPERQAEAMANVSALLKPKGLFLYLDLIDFASPHLASLAHKDDLSFIEREMRDAPADVSPSDWSCLRERWLKHYREENHLLPLDGAGPHTVLDLLEQAGLERAEVLFRQLHTTMLIAFKA